MSIANPRYRWAGFAPIGDGARPSCYRNDRLGLVLTIHADELRMESESDTIKQCWKLTNGLVEHDPPIKIGTYLGCLQHADTVSVRNRDVCTMAYEVNASPSSCCDLYLELLPNAPRFSKVTSPSTPEDHTDAPAARPASDDGESSLPITRERTVNGVPPRGPNLTHIPAARVIMKGMYAGRMARPDLLKTIGGIDRFLTKCV